MRIALLGALLALTADAQAGVTASVVTAGGSRTSVTVAPGGSFSVDIRLEIQETSIVSAQLQLQAGANDVLSVTSGSYNGSDWITSTSTALAIEQASLGTSPAVWIGTLPVNGQIGPATTVLATVNLLVSPSAADGTYTLNVANIVTGDLTFTDIGGTAGPDFSVIVSSGGTTPPDDGGTTPPDDGGTTPPDDGGTTPPDDGGTTPPDGGTTPDDGSPDPPDDGTTTPVVVGRCGAGMVESLALSLTGLLLIGRETGRRRRAQP